MAVVIGDALAAALPSLRQHAESLMVDTVRVERPDGRGGSSPVYLGRGKVQVGQALARTPADPTHTATVRTLRVDLPVAAEPVDVGDVVAVTAAALDPALVGRTFRVVERTRKTMATAIRTHVDEVQA